MYATREKLGGSESAEYEAATGEEERDALREGMGAAEDWLYEDGELSSWFLFSSPSVRGVRYGLMTIHCHSNSNFVCSVRDRTNIIPSTSCCTPLRRRFPCPSPRRRRRHCGGLQGQAGRPEVAGLPHAAQGGGVSGETHPSQRHRGLHRVVARPGGGVGDL